MGRSLVLNASESPLAVVTARRAVVMVLKEKADVVLSNGMVFHSERLTFEAPSVVRLRRYVHVPYRPHAPLTRRAVFARDLGVCQYCGGPAENLDHVIPRSRGGRTHGRTWWRRADAATLGRRTAHRRRRGSPSSGSRTRPVTAST